MKQVFILRKLNVNIPLYVMSFKLEEKKNFTEENIEPKKIVEYYTFVKSYKLTGESRFAYVFKTEQEAVDESKFLDGEFLPIKRFV